VVDLLGNREVSSYTHEDLRRVHILQRRFPDLSIVEKDRVKFCILRRCRSTIASHLRQKCLDILLGARACPPLRIADEINKLRDRREIGSLRFERIAFRADFVRQLRQFLLFLSELLLIHGFELSSPP
jgi:hypothetical protein